MIPQFSCTVNHGREVAFMEVSLWDMKRIFVMQGPYKVLVMAMLFINLKRAVSLVFDNYLLLY